MSKSRRHCYPDNCGNVNCPNIRFNYQPTPDNPTSHNTKAASTFIRSYSSDIIDKVDQETTPLLKASDDSIDDNLNVARTYNDATFYFDELTSEEPISDIIKIDFARLKNLLWNTCFRPLFGPSLDETGISTYELVYIIIDYFKK
ncbi:uncharacterized protein LOC143191797 [Rhynchophorus ferrugineus]|uniref:uncharacterized protein LOC143191797 n=1 Tax=Rhynchophorus ferrugineus TaxID=354439 RepID=UPI003FCCEB65